MVVSQIHYKVLKRTPIHVGKDGGIEIAKEAFDATYLDSVNNYIRKQRGRHEHPEEVKGGAEEVLKDVDRRYAIPRDRSFVKMYRHRRRLRNRVRAGPQKDVQSSHRRTEGGNPVARRTRGERRRGGFLRDVRRDDGQRSS